MDGTRPIVLSGLDFGTFESVEAGDSTGTGGHRNPLAPAGGGACPGDSQLPCRCLNSVARSLERRAQSLGEQPPLGKPAPEPLLDLRPGLAPNFIMVGSSLGFSCVRLRSFLRRKQISLSPQSMSLSDGLAMSPSEAARRQHNS
jgi:hypothetical protein